MLQGYYRIADSENTTINKVVEGTTSDVHATTHFSTDANARSVEPQNMGDLHQFDALMPKDWSNLSLHTLLSQPVPVASGVASGDLSFGFPSHQTILNNSSFHLDKVRGYTGIRATIVVRMVVNADKYTQGRLLLSYQPTNTEFGESLTDFRRLTQLTHVELDLNTDTEVTLRIPHRGPYTHFDITNRRFNTGIFRVDNMLPWRGAPYAYTVYASFEDVHLLGPTAIQTVSYESGLEKEEHNVPLSTKVKNLASAMVPFSGVPLIGSYISPLAWATSVAGNVLSAFGWSKPLMTTTPEVFITRADAKYNHSDGSDYAEQLAVTTTTGVRASDQIGLTQEDEMSLPFLLGISSALYRFSYGVTVPSGTKLYSVPLCPVAMSAAGTIGGTVVSHPMAYIANLFHLYRGSITMTVDLSKTIFHSGRLMVVFEPIISDRTDSLPPSRINTIADAINCHKDIVDIRKGNSFSFTFPYTSLVPYLPVEAPYGYAHIFVVNQLVRNDAAVSDLVDVALKFRGEEDFEFAAPCVPRLWPYTPAVGTVTAVVNDETKVGEDGIPSTLPGFTYQSGLEVGDSVIVRKPIGASVLPQPSHDFAALCIGEKIRSMKQVAMRMKLVYSGAGTSRVFKFAHCVDSFKDALFGVPDASVNSCHDFYSYVGMMYNYARGGVIVSVENLSGIENLHVALKSDYANFSNGVAENAEFALRGTVYPERTERFYLPPYDHSVVRFTEGTPITGGAEYADPPDAFYNFGFNSSRLQVFLQNSGDTTKNYKLSRSAAEDTQFGGFRSCPLMILRAPFNNLAGGPGGTDWKVQAINDLSFPVS